MIRSITIICQDDGHFDVHEGERFANGLIFDEMLGEVSRLTTNSRTRYMQTPDQRLAVLERYQRLRAEAAANTITISAS